MSCQLLTRGLTYWFPPEGDGVVGYVSAARTRVVAAAPVCLPERLAAVTRAFAADAASHGARVCYFGAQAPLLDALAWQTPTARMVLGAEPGWDPANWPHILRRKASLRAQLARARHKDVTVVAVEAEVARRAPAFRQCLKGWLATRHLPPMHFLVEPDALAVPGDHQVFAAYRASTVIGYLVAVPIPRRNGWLIQQIIRSHAAPNGTAELLVDAAMRSFAERGASYVTLGLAPLSTHAPDHDHSVPPMVRLLLKGMRSYGQPFYNFAGLDAFKAKLQPETWEPIYAVSNERQISLHTLYAITEAFAGVPPLSFFSYGLVRAVGQKFGQVAQSIKRGPSG